jgi:NAD(P)H-flavin reductase
MLRFEKMKYNTLLIVCMMMMLSVSEALSTSTKVLSNDINITISLPSTTTIQFEITANNTYWVAFGFGSNTMTNSDMLSITGTLTTVEDRYSTGRSFPAFDTTSHYTLTSVTGINPKVYTVTRLLSTGDIAQDYIIPDGVTEIIYAWGSSSTFGKHGTGNIGNLAMNITAATRDVSIQDGTVSSNDNAIIHGLLNYFAWSWLSMLLIISGRYSKYFYTFRMFVHVLSGLAVLILTLVAIYGYSSFARPYPSANSLGDKHTSLANVIIAWTVIIIVLGIIVKAALVKFGRFSFLGYYARYIHMIGAVCLIIYSQIVILSGLFYYDSPITFLFYIHLAIMILLIIGFELFWQFKRPYKYTNIDALERKNLPEMTIEEFHKSDKKLSLFDQYVIDFGLYSYDHPGGKWVIDEVKGKEIGKYFYGAYSLDSNIKIHRHSWIAGKILVKLAVAKLTQPGDKNSGSIGIGAREESVRSEIGLGAKEELVASEKAYKVTEKTELFQNVFRVKFANSSSEFKIRVRGLNTFGKHYVISSLKNHVSRYYTICNSLNSEAYEFYLAAFGGNNEVTDTIPETSNELQLTMKFYPQSKNGITKQLMDSDDNQMFLINGPFGKGLDFSAESICGNNIIFLGGTGVLPFVDFFTYLGRSLYNQVNSSNLIENENFEDHFKQASFVVYGYFPKESEAVALELCSKISEFHAQNNAQERFSFIPIFTREGGERLGKDKIFDILSNYHSESKLKNVWVCGPPPMNNMFQRFRKEIIKRYDLSPNQLEIL